MSDLQELLNAKNLEIVELKRRVAELEDENKDLKEELENIYEFGYGV